LLFAGLIALALIAPEPRHAHRGAEFPGLCLLLLAPVYGWFTEGFDTRDLKEAKALLDELAA
jgi:hypothetical protein